MKVLCALHHFKEKAMVVIDGEEFEECPNCKGWIIEAFYYCVHCGKLLPLPEDIQGLIKRKNQNFLRTHNHEHEKKDGYKFCRDCGKKL